MNHLRNNADFLGQSRLTSEQFDRFVKSFHARHNKHVGIACQHVVFA